MKKSALRWQATLCAVLLATACRKPDYSNPAPAQQQESVTGVTDARLAAAAKEPQNWLTYGGTQDEQRFSPLTAINTGTVKQLGLSWDHEFAVNRGMEATPLVADGILYTTTAWSKVHAFNAATGQLLWSYDPKVPGKSGFNACCDVVNRGAAIYDGKIFFGTLDGRLIALDAKTGQPVWSIVTVDQSKPYTITGAPRIVKGRVLIGNGGAEYGVRGYVSAYDAKTGALDWRFYTVPTKSGGPDGAASDPIMAKAKATWAGDFDKFGGGGTVWDSIVYDRTYNQILIGVGNGSPWNYQLRSQSKGDNLFISSVVALDADTGAYKWHYQGTPGDSWDFTQTNSIILATLPVAGKPTPVMMQAPKNGFFYVIDRKDGRLVSAKNFVKQNWNSGFDAKTGRPVFVPAARYQGTPFVVTPSGLGAHNWQPMAFSPQTGLAYIPAQEVPFAYGNTGPFVPRAGGWNTGTDFGINAIPDEKAKLAAIRPLLKGHLAAWDPVKQKEAWRVEFDGPWNGGVLATAGALVFEGSADGKLSAFDAKTGRTLWSFDAKMGIMAPPISYAVDGKQYIAVMAGYGGAYGVSSAFSPNTGPRPNGRLLVFAIDGKAPYTVQRNPSGPPVIVAQNWTPAQVEHGRQIFETTCAMCHGAGAHSSGVLPDLRRSGALADADAWKEILINGALQDQGMVSFKKWLSPADVEDVRGYVAMRAKALKKNGG